MTVRSLATHNARPSALSNMSNIVKRLGINHVVGYIPEYFSTLGRETMHTGMHVGMPGLG